MIYPVYLTMGETLIWIGRLAVWNILSVCWCLLHHTISLKLIFINNYRELIKILGLKLHQIFTNKTSTQQLYN